MSTHVTEDRLLAHLDGELPPGETRAVAEHLGGCAECAARYEAVGRRAAAAEEALRTLDVPPPWTEMPGPLRAAARGARAAERPREAPANEVDEAEETPTVRPLDSAPSRRGTPWWRRPVAVAAGFLLLVAAGASAIPGSPLRGWIADSAAAVAGLFDGGPAEREVEAVATPAEPDDTGTATVSVRPEDGRLIVTVRAPRPGARLRVRTVDAERASASAASARYDVAPGRLDVLDLEGALLVSLPATLREGAVEVDGRRVADLRDGIVRRTAAADSLAPQILVEVEG